MIILCNYFHLKGGSPLPDILQEAHIDVISNNDCRKKWLFYINDGHVCVTDIPTESKGACNVSDVNICLHY